MTKVCKSLVRSNSGRELAHKSLIPQLGPLPCNETMQGVTHIAHNTHTEQSKCTFSA